ncbi:MAG TPA: phytanoyl-CoA dioxygenase family protein [Armatimonadota bacterium]
MSQPNNSQFYQKNGFVLLRAVFTAAEVEAMREACDAIIARAREAKQNPSFLWQGRFLSDEERARLDITGIHDAQFHDAVFSRMLLNDRLLAAVDELIGPNIQLHHTKLIAKPPETGAPFPMHQDYPYFPHEKHTMLAASIHLDNTDELNGCLRVVPGSHKLGALDLDPTGLFLAPERYPIETAQPLPAQAGDALVFNYLTIHGSGVNASNRPRRNWLIQMRDPTDHPTKDVHVSRGQGMMLRGHNPEYIATWA